MYFSNSNTRNVFFLGHMKQASQAYEACFLGTLPSAIDQPRATCNHAMQICTLYIPHSHLEYGTKYPNDLSNSTHQSPKPYDHTFSTWKANAHGSANLGLGKLPELQRRWIESVGADEPPHEPFSHRSPLPSRLLLHRRRLPRVFLATIALPWEMRRGDMLSIFSSPPPGHAKCIPC
jgi:hypothetical protein